MIVGTAGHIDHGKTALVKALTGVDADRLKEEKARGITIDLGFAYRPLEEGRITGFIDVPGHERFVHTMLAGAGGIDLALLVVAADDGVMPQTREHVAILDLLGIRRGLVALSKADRADAPRRAAVAAEIATLLAPTGLRGAPIVPVSTVTREGVDAIEAHLAAAERETAHSNGTGAFRLAVDRCFTLPGAGVVVTGTVLSGAVTVGDRVVISPSGRPARVRALHAQNRPAERGTAGQRCALNLAGDAVTKDVIARGDVVLAPALHAPTDRIDVELRLLPGEAKAVGAWFPARFHLGSAEAGARIVPLDDAIAPGGRGRAQLVLDRPLAGVAGDRFVIRDVSAQRTIGGGRLLDLRPPARKRRTPERLAQLEALARAGPETAFAALLALPPFWVDAAAFARDHALGEVLARDLERHAGLVLPAGPARIALAPEAWNRFARHLDTVLAEFHAEHPDLQGIGRERLRLEVEPRLPPEAFRPALERQAEAGAIALEGAFVRLPGHAVQLSAVDEALWAQVAPLLAGEGLARFRPPRVRDLSGLLDTAEPDVRRLLKLCGRLGRVDQVAHDHFFLRNVTVEMAALARHMAAQAPDGAFTAAQFRDRMDNGRKVAIQILDFFDRHGVTLRRGDLRRINPHRLDLFGLGPPPAAEGRDASPVGRPDFKSGWGSETVPGGFDSHSLPPSGAPR